MTKAALRRINGQLRTLRAERRALLTGAVYANTGMPWCDGPGSPYHQEPLCDGCAVAALCRSKAEHVAMKISDLESRLAPVSQAALW